jgi:hypothetical protein
MMIRVCVKAKDYSYYGEVVGMAVKRSGLVRFVVEDENGRLFIHSAENLGMPECRMSAEHHLTFAGQLAERDYELVKSLVARMGGKLPDGR